MIPRRESRQCFSAGVSHPVGLWRFAPSSQEKKAMFLEDLEIARGESFRPIESLATEEEMYLPASFTPTTEFPLRGRDKMTTTGRAWKNARTVKKRSTRIRGFTETRLFVPGARNTRGDE